MLCFFLYKKFNKKTQKNLCEEFRKGGGAESSIKATATL